MTITEIDNRFTSRAPKAHQPETYGHICGLLRTVALAINAECPDSAEKSLAIRKLEEAMFWAHEAVARNE